MQAGSMRGVGRTVVLRPASRHHVHRTRIPLDGLQVILPAPERTWTSAQDDEAGRPELEIVPLEAKSQRVVGDTLQVRVLFRGNAVSGGQVTVIPHGRTLPPYGTPNRWDLVTDEQGVARYEIADPGVHLVVAHVEAPEGRAVGVPCAAALVVIVQQRPDVDCSTSHPYMCQRERGE